MALDATVAGTAIVPFGTSAVVPCTSCGTLVKRSAFRLRNKMNAFCSRACYAVALASRRPHNYGQRAVALKLCEQCGATFARQPAKSRIRRFCSSRCAGAFFSGPNAPAWRGGITMGRKQLFNTAAYREWRAAVLTRDGGRCRWCDSEGQWTYHRLELHHIVPVSAAPEAIFEVANGITLCKQHHNLTRGRESVYADMLAGLLGTPLITDARSSNPKRLPLIVAADELQRLYWTEGLTLGQIGARYNVTGDCIGKHMRRHGIERRPVARRAA